MRRWAKNDRFVLAKHRGVHGPAIADHAVSLLRDLTRDLRFGLRFGLRFWSGEKRSDRALSGRRKKSLSFNRKFSCPVGARFLHLVQFFTPDPNM